VARPALDETELPATVHGRRSSRDTSDRSAVAVARRVAARTRRGARCVVSVLPLNPAEDIARTLVVVSDTTDRTRLERMRRDFVANASHELKTPTAAIHLLAESAMSAAETATPNRRSRSRAASRRSRRASADS
jgi:signal transduction histidine kinase